MPCVRGMGIWLLIVRRRIIRSCLVVVGGLFLGVRGGGCELGTGGGCLSMAFSRGAVNWEGR